MNLRNMKMRAIPESQRGNHAIVSMQDKFPLMRSNGSVNYVCAGCGITIFEAVTPDQYSGLAIKCGGCSSLNVIPADS